MKIIVALLITVVFLLSRRFIGNLIDKMGTHKSVTPYRIKYITKTLNLALTVFFVILLSLFMGIEYQQLSLFLSSVFAVIGVALFAQWSILSNITASMIIFFSFPYRVGDRIKVVDKDDDIQGIVEEISLFHVMIRRNNELITYPNTLILQKAVIKLPAENARPASSPAPLSGQDIEES
jgi:small-conductance mechanosensitive channel